MIIGAVLAFWVHAAILPDLTLHLHDAIKNAWGVDDAFMRPLEICGYPSRVANIVLAMETVARFGHVDLEVVPGFFRVGDHFELDLDERWAGTGFLVPIVNRQFGIYSGLLAFRNPRDKKPFMVQVRNWEGKA